MKKPTGNQLDFIVQQFTGWRAHQSHQNIDLLIEEMGMTAEEWAILNKRGDLIFLTGDDLERINEHFLRK